MTLEVPTLPEGADMDPHKLLSWFEESVQPFLLKYAPEKLYAIQADKQRLNVLRESRYDITVCFLGNSGVGKSTLLNALVAGECQILPAGGIGPLTAQATEVRYSEEKQFHVTYHPKTSLWKLVKELDKKLSELADNLSEEDQNKALQQARFGQTGLPEEEMSSVEVDDYYIQQAKTLVCGKQFADKSLEYLVDALRSACDRNLKWGAVIDLDDQVRLDRVREIMNLPTRDRSYERREGDDPKGFQEDMASHAAGFLSPLIARIEVGWPSEVLKFGVILVDLPGVGIAQDSYRDVTKSYVRDKARAVILTVDQAGPTESTMDLLRTSGYWGRLVGAADDPESDTCPMLIAVTRVDDVAQTKWQNERSNLAAGALRSKKGEVFAQLVEEFKPRIKSQIVEQLARIGDSSNKSVNLARNQARNSIIQSLEIHPISAPEFRKILLDDKDDHSFLTDIEQTGIPKLQASLENLARREAALRRSSIEELTQRLARIISSELKLIKTQSDWN